jgi:6-phosphogluconate dehydrogenase
MDIHKARKMTKEQYDVGLVGLGLIGHNLLLNMADHWFAVAGYDKDPGKVKMLRAGHLPTNLIQAQPDYFGAHTYENVNMNGNFHTQWLQE